MDSSRPAAAPTDVPSPSSDAGTELRGDELRGDELRVQEVRVEGGARLGHGETRVFELAYAGRTREAFVLAHEGSFFAYLNECPHWSVELDLGDGHFYDEDLDRVYCKNHGAIFSPTTGECDSGPCLGRSLVALRIRRDGDDILVSS